MACETPAMAEVFSASGINTDASGKLDMVRLKEEVESCSKILSQPGTSHPELVKASKQFFSLIIGAWSLDTSHALDAAEMVCNTIR